MRGGIDPGHLFFRSRAVGIAEGCPNGEWDPTVRGCGRNGARVGWGFPHHAGRYRPGRPRFSSPCWLDLSMYGDISGDGALPSQRKAGFIFVPQPIIDRPMELEFTHSVGRCRTAATQPISDGASWLGFPLCAGRYRPGGTRFPSPGC